MNKFNHLIVALILTVFIACHKQNTTDTTTETTNTTPPRKVVFTDTLTLKMSETVISGNYSLRLDSIEDSRCATDITCIWAGSVRAKLLIQKNMESQIVRIYNMPKFDTATVFNQTIRFLSVLPDRGKSANVIPQKDYVIKLLVQ
jgi:hypothetical protein